MKVKQVLRRIFFKPSGLFFLAWMLLGSAISAKINNHPDHAVTLVLACCLVFLLDGIINLFIEDKL